MSRMIRTVIELLALAVGLVGGYLYLAQRRRTWLFWLLALAVVVVVFSWHGRRRLKNRARRLAG